MNKDRVAKTIQRLDNLLNTIRFQNSGADIHTLGNIRNSAQLLKSQLETDPDCLSENLVYQIVRNIEKDIVMFFKKKYFSACPSALNPQSQKQLRQE